MARHLRWERAGRTLEWSPTQRAYRAQVAQQNVELPDGSFAPYVWDDATKTLRYAGIEARFKANGSVEFWRDGDQLAVTTPRLERRAGQGWAAQAASRIRIEQLGDEDDLGPIAYARIAIVIESPRATARHILVAGGRQRARADTELDADVPDDFRVAVDHDLGPAQRREWRGRGTQALVATGYESSKGWRVAWTGDEDGQRTVRGSGGRVTVELPAGAPRVSPDTYGPVTNAGSHDDSLSRQTGGSAQYRENGLTGFGAPYDNAFYVDDFSGDADRSVAWRFASINLGGTPASIDTGTILALDRTSLDGGAGANGVVRFRCQASNTPATGSSGTGETGRPCVRTYNTAFNDHTFPTTTTDQNVPLHTAIGGLITAGYSYTGDSTHAIMIACGSEDIWGLATPVSYRGIGYDVTHATGLPADLTIVYTPSGGGSNVSPSAIATAEAHGSPAFSVAVSPSAIATAEAHGSPTVASGLVVVQPSGLSSEEAHGSGLVRFRILVTAIAAGEAFGLPLFGMQVTPGGIAAGEAFGVATAQFGFTVPLSGIASTALVSTAILSVNVQATGLTSLAEVGAPTFGSSLQPAAIESAAVVETASLGLRVAADGASSEEAFGDAGVLPGVVVAAPNGIASAYTSGSVGVRVVTAVFPGAIASEEGVGAAAVTAEVVVISATITSNEEFGQSRLRLYANASGISTLESFGEATLEATGLQLLPVGVETGEAVGTSLFRLFVAPASVSASSAVGSGSLRFVVRSAAISSTLSFGQVLLVPGAAPIQATAIGSAEGLGAVSTFQAGIVMPSGVSTAESFGAARVARWAYPLAYSVYPLVPGPVTPSGVG